MSLLRFSSLALVAALAACGGQVKRINPPAVSVQQAVVQPDGRWTLTLRIQNFSTVPTRFGGLDATLTAAGASAHLAFDTALDVPPNSADVLDTTVAIAATPSGEFEYELKGSIDSTEPKGHFPIERKSRLTPVPGLTHTYR